jgi:Kdo2-lipid IVA lauroyltransferase/acyltransferase
LHLLARAWGFLLSQFSSRSKHTTQKNLKSCFPEKTENEIVQLTKSSLTNTAATALEMGKMWLPPMEKTLKMVVASEGREEFVAAHEAGNGVILLAPHLGNWEIFAFYLCDDLESTWLYQPPKLPALDRLITKTRSRGGLTMAPTNRAGVSKVLKTLKEGKLAGVLPDQVPPDEGGVYAPFFGEEAFTMTLVSKLVQKTDAKVFCGFANRLPSNQGYKVIVESADESIYSHDIDESVAALNRTVQKSVNRAVEQYQWEYKRFRKQRDGSKFY